MPRSLSPAFLAQLGSTGMSAPVLFVVLAFADQTLYLFGGVGSLTPAGPAYSATSTFPYGETFIGMGWLGKVSTVPQTNKVQAQNVTLALSGIPSELVLEAINEVSINGSATIYLGFFDNTGALIADPVQLFAGALDVPTLSDSGPTCTISITAENPLLRLNEAPARTFDDADQQIYFPGDLGMSFVDALGNLTLFWPSPYGSGSPYPISMGVVPNGDDVGVGSTIQISVQINFSDGSYYEYPAGIGGGPSFTPSYASTDPAIATVTEGGVVTGVSAGKCSIIARVPFPLYSGGPALTPGGQYRAAAAVIVHS
jgi:hypothetical protein